MQRGINVQSTRLLQYKLKKYYCSFLYIFYHSLLHSFLIDRALPPDAPCYLHVTSLHDCTEQEHSDIVARNAINQSINQSWIYIAHKRKASNALHVSNNNDTSVQQRIYPCGITIVKCPIVEYYHMTLSIACKDELKCVSLQKKQHKYMLKNNVEKT